MPTVLVVDDEPAVLDITRLFLARSGLTVLTASGAAEALRRFASAGGEVDLLITDVLMPGTDGPTLAGHLLEFKPELAVLFVSGFCNEPELGIDGRFGFLQKPFAPQELIREANALVGAAPARPLGSLGWEELRQRSAELARRCLKLALELEGLDERAEQAIRRSRGLLGQE